MSKPIIETMMVQDPSMTDAEYYHQRQMKPGPHVGKVAARVSMSSLIGGLARLHGVTDAQKMAAARYRSLYEGAQIGGARAVDYAAVKVDTSGPPPQLAIEHGEDARRKYSAAVRHLGMIRSSLVESVIVHDIPMVKIAGLSSRARARKTQELFDILDDLAVHFKLINRRAA